MTVAIPPLPEPKENHTTTTTITTTLSGRHFRSGNFPLWRNILSRNSTFQHICFLWSVFKNFTYQHTSSLWSMSQKFNLSTSLRCHCLRTCRYISSSWSMVNAWSHFMVNVQEFNLSAYAFSRQCPQISLVKIFRRTIIKNFYFLYMFL